MIYFKVSTKLDLISLCMLTGVECGYGLQNYNIKNNIVIRIDNFFLVEAVNVLLLFALALQGSTL